MDINTQLPEMVIVVDIQFKSGGKSYSFDPGGLTLAPGDEVIIDTQRGQEFGLCQRGNHGVLADQVVQPLRQVLRLADDADRQRLKDNALRESQAFDVCQSFIERLGLDMKLVRVEQAFDGSKLLFFFTSDGRVDFRELVKELASVYRTRIEMRQIGVRDEARLLGGLGICGRPLCCAQFLEEFQPVSIKMAKTQSLSLNPTKISGTCGRLMCCLKYEQEAYEDLLRTSPRQGSLVDTVDGRGTVLDVSLLRQQVKVGLEQSPDTVKYYPNDEIAVLRDGKGKKTDPPIPPEIAPISGDPARRAKLQSSRVKDEPLPEISYHSDRVDLWEDPDQTPAPEPAETPKPRNRRRRPPRQQGENREPRENRENRENREPREPREPRGDRPEQKPRRQRQPRAPQQEGARPERQDSRPEGAKQEGWPENGNRRRRPPRRNNRPKPPQDKGENS